MILRILRRTQHFLTAITRDRRGLPSLLFVPVGLLLLMGWVIKSADNDITVAIVAEGDHWAVGDIAAQLRDTFAENDVDTIQPADEATAEQALRDGDADGYIVVDEAFAGAVLGGERDDVRVGITGDSISVKDETLREINRALVLAPLRVLREATGSAPLTEGGAARVDTVYVYGGEEYDSFDELLPALFAFIIYLTIFSSALVIIASDRAMHTLERIMATPMRRWEYVAGTVLGYTVMALIQAVSIVLAAVFVLDAHFAGNVAAILIVTGVVAVSGVSLSVFFSAFARSEPEAMQMLPLALIPQFIICGVLFPISAMPDVLQQVARFLPVTYGVDALQDVMLRGRALTDPEVLADIAVMLAFAAFFVVLGTRALQPEEQ